MFESEPNPPQRLLGIKSQNRLFPRSLHWAMVYALLFASPLSHGEPAIRSPEDYLERAQEFRQAGDLRREQFELTKSLRSWPNSSKLRYAYALHLVRRKNLSAALIHTTHSLGHNQEQPVMANLHLRILDELGRPADSVAWLGRLLTLKRALPPLQPWSTEWVQRWQQVLQMGRKHADKTSNTGTRALIDEALRWATPAESVTQPPEN